MKSICPPESETNALDKRADAETVLPDSSRDVAPRNAEAVREGCQIGQFAVEGATDWFDEESVKCVAYEISRLFDLKPEHRVDAIYGLATVITPYLQHGTWVLENHLNKPPMITAIWTLLNKRRP